MAFRRNFAPAVANSMNVKALQEQSRIDDGTSRANAIAEKDLQFWIPQAALLVPEGVQPVQTLEELLTLPKAHIATVLAAVLKIFRQKRKIDGKRYTNVSLKLKVEAWQRIIRGHFQMARV